MVEHVLGNLRCAGYGRFLLVVGYRHELFYAKFAGDRTVHFALQDPVDGTGSAARLARGFTEAEPFLLMFGDILADPADLRGMWDLMTSRPEAAAVLAVKRVEDPWQGAAVYESGGVVERIVEKPPRGTSSTYWNSAGIFVFRPGVFDVLDRLTRSLRGEYELTDAIVALLAQGAVVLAHPLTGEWRDVGRPEDIEAAMRITS